MSVQKYKDELRYNNNLIEYCDSVTCIFQNKQVKFYKHFKVLRNAICNIYALSGQSEKDIHANIMYLTMYDGTIIPLIKRTLKHSGHLIVVCEQSITDGIKSHITDDRLYIETVEVNLLKRVHSKHYEAYLLCNISKAICRLQLTKASSINIFFNKQTNLFFIPDVSNRYFFTNKYNGSIFIELAIICYFYFFLHQLCVREYKSYYESINTINKMNTVSRREIRKLISNKFFSICAKMFFI